MLSKAILLIGASVLLAACDGVYYNPERPTNLIGTKLEDMSSLNDDAGNDINKIVVYDQTVSRIHQFNLDNMNIERSLPVLNPGIPHNVLYNLTGNYVIDFTTKHISFYDRLGTPTHNPIRFVGTPISAAFRPSLGLLVVYDSLMSVGILKVNGSGSVLQARKVGSDLGSNRTIAAGDIDDGGRLILALSDGTIVKVDLDATLSSGVWTLTGAPIVTGLTDINWVAPVRGQPNQVMVATKDKMAVVDTSVGAVIGTPTTLDGSIVWRSKGIDAHILTSSYSTSGVRIYYVSGSAVLSKKLQRASGGITHSRLDLSSDDLTFVTAGSYKWRANSLDSSNEPVDRMIRQWRFSDLDAQLEEKVVDGAKLALAKRSVFALMENKLGWALNYDLYSGAPPMQKRGFNVPYIP
jgi:hypothetical protein